MAGFCNAGTEGEVTGGSRTGGVRVTVQPLLPATLGVKYRWTWKNEYCLRSGICAPLVLFLALFVL